MVNEIPTHSSTLCCANLRPLCHVLPRPRPEPLPFAAAAPHLSIPAPLFLLSLYVLLYPVGVDREDSLKALRKAYEGEEAIKVYDAFRSHAAIARKNRLLLTLLDDIRQANAEVGGCGVCGVCDEGRRAEPTSSVLKKKVHASPGI